MSLDHLSLTVEVGPIPPLTDAELRQFYDQGVSRVGVVALLLDPSMKRMLLQEHTASAKTKAGMWGGLGETSRATRQNGGWRLESPLDTVARGLYEERGVKMDTLWVPRRVPVFFMEWPVGVDRSDIAHAVCPVIVVSDAMVAAIEDAPITDEVTRSVFVPVEQGNDGRLLRPGMDRWIPFAQQAVMHNAGADLQVVQLPTAPLQEPTQEAILEEMYG